MKIKLFLLVLFFSFALFASKEDMLFNLARFYAKSGDFTKAIEKLNKILEINPNNKKARDLLNKCQKAQRSLKETGKIPDLFGMERKKNRKISKSLLERKEKEIANLLNDGKYFEAIDILNWIIKFNPDYAKSYYQLGIIYSNLHKYKMAIDNFDKSLKLDPNNAYAYFYKGIALYSIGKHKEGFKSMLKSLEINPSNSFFKQQIGEYYLRDWQLDKAERLLKEALKLEKNNKVVIKNLLILYVKRKDFIKVNEIINLVKSKNPSDGFALYWEKIIRLIRGDVVNIDINKFNGSKNLKNMIVNGLYNVKIGNIKKAEEILEKISDSDDYGWFLLLFEVAKYYFDNQDYKNSLKYLKMITKKEPFNFYANMLIGKIYRKQVLTDKAIGVFYLLYNHNIREYELLKELGQALSEKGYYLQAIDVYREAFKKAPTSEKDYINNEIRRLDELYYNQLNPPTNLDEDSNSEDTFEEDDFF